MKPTTQTIGGTNNHQHYELHNSKYYKRQAEADLRKRIMYWLLVAIVITNILIFLASILVLQDVLHIEKSIQNLYYKLDFT